VGWRREGLPEDVDVLSGTLVPAEVHVHAPHDHLSPRFLVVFERVDGIVDSILFVFGLGFGFRF